jgi:hypothetical protein
LRPGASGPSVVVVEQPIAGFHLDEVGDWVADLACGHRQHVRHRPPFQQRPWVLDPIERRARVGTPLECRLCDEGDGVDGVDEGDRADGGPGPDEGDRADDQGGESSCLAHLLCPECGTVLDGGPHRAGCVRGDPG